MSSRFKSGVGDRGLDGLHGERQRRSHQPAADGRHSDTGDGHPVLEPVRAEQGPNPAAVVLGGCLVVGSGGVGFVDRGEEGDPDVVAGFEAGCHPHADPGLVGGDVDQVGDEADPGVLLEGDGGDDKRRGKPGIPLMMVDGDAHDHARPETSRRPIWSDRQ